MNKFLVFASIVAVYFCMVEAATNEEIQNAIINASQKVRQEKLLALKSGIRDSMISATTPQQRSCIKWQISRAAVGLNQALNAEQAAAESEYLNLPPQEMENLDSPTLSQQLYDRFSSSVAAAAYSKEALFSQCA
ncbi:uncharacterized protein [Halyomorpha halys]|uniref:uncharacterized protein n=1 Tax=Halyomorpha halys TaxID=286706 RepID=UPI0006D4CBF5|nr:uncharacterized protein LOC106682891 [Halyomorpha halys]